MNWKRVSLVPKAKYKKKKKKKGFYSWKDKKTTFTSVCSETQLARKVFIQGVSKRDASRRQSTYWTIVKVKVNEHCFVFNKDKLEIFNTAKPLINNILFSYRTIIIEEYISSLNSKMIFHIDYWRIHRYLRFRT